MISVLETGRFVLKKKRGKIQNGCSFHMGKKVTASSGRMAGAVTDENIRTWWKADEDQDKNWIEVDLEKSYDVRAIQINFADDVIYVDDNVQIENTASLGNLSVSEKNEKGICFQKVGLF